MQFRWVQINRQLLHQSRIREKWRNKEGNQVYINGRTILTALCHLLTAGTCRPTSNLYCSLNPKIKQNWWATPFTQDRDIMVKEIIWWDTDIRAMSNDAITVKDRIRNLQPCCFGEFPPSQIKYHPTPSLHFKHVHILKGTSVHFNMQNLKHLPSFKCLHVIKLNT